MIKQRITSKKIAELANVNESTVSRAFSPLKQHLISEQVRKRILAIAEEYEYEPKSAARSLAQGKSFQLGIILHDLEADLSSPNLSLFLSEFCREAIRNNYQTLLLPIEGGEFDMETVKTIRSSRADAYFIARSLMGMRTMDELTKRNIPVASYISDGFIPNSQDNITFIHTNNTPAYDQMFQTVKERGFKNLAIFSHSIMKNHPRLDIQPLLKKHSIKLDEKIFFESSNFSAMTRRESCVAAQKIIDRLMQHKLIFCASDIVALGLCDALHDAGIEPGKDISIIAYDNTEGHKTTAPLQEPILATIEKNDRLAGKTMVKTLLNDIDDSEHYKKKRKDINIPTEFILRKSLGWNK
jgi:LacI family transcriptional regulator, galactose operon repressor